MFQIDQRGCRKALSIGDAVTIVRISRHANVFCQTSPGYVGDIGVDPTAVGDKRESGGVPFAVVFNAEVDFPYVTENVYFRGGGSVSYYHPQTGARVAEEYPGIPYPAMLSRTLGVVPQKFYRRRKVTENSFLWTPGGDHEGIISFLLSGHLLPHCDPMHGQPMPGMTTSPVPAPPPFDPVVEFDAHLYRHGIEPQTWESTAPTTVGWGFDEPVLLTLSGMTDEGAESPAGILAALQASRHELAQRAAVQAVAAQAAEERYRTGLARLFRAPW